MLNAAEGERVIVWHLPPRDGPPVFLYFHGNGGSTAGTLGERRCRGTATISRVNAKLFIA